MPKIINDKLFTDTLNYLATRPYSEVATGITGLMQSPEAPNNEKIFEALASCIRSGQVPDEDVPKIMAENPDFAAWYRERYGVEA